MVDERKKGGVWPLNKFFVSVKGVKAKKRFPQKLICIDSERAKKCILVSPRGVELNECTGTVSCDFLSHMFIIIGIWLLIYKLK